MNRFHGTTGTIHRRERGATLVELMISLLLGLLLTAGIIQIFVGNRVTYAFNDGLSRIQENARFALDQVAFNTRMAGYKGCISDVAIYNNLNTGTAIDFALDLENGIFGHEASGTGTGQVFSDPAEVWTPGLPAVLAGLPIAGSDVLIVRGVSSDANSLVSPFTNSAQVFVSEPHDFVEGDVLVATDCQKASIFQVTNVQATGVGINLVHAQSNGYVPGNNISNWDTAQDYGLGAEVARLQARAFYVGTGADGRPALFQLRLQSSVASAFVPEELATGIDTMQVRYGVDLDNNGTIDRWETADTVGTWRNVVSIEVTLVARSTEEYGQERDTAIYEVGGGTRFNPPADDQGLDDRRLRQVFSTTIGVRNRLP
jgi:type IV pilus assembly protein PilW